MFSTKSVAPTTLQVYDQHLILRSAASRTIIHTRLAHGEEDALQGRVGDPMIVVQLRSNFNAEASEQQDAPAGFSICNSPNNSLNMSAL
jgi:hypothetical protein